MERKDFVSSLDYSLGDRVEFLSFDSFVMYMCTLTNDVNLLQNGIYNMVPEGETAMYDAIYEGLPTFPGEMQIKRPLEREDIW